MTLLAIPWFVLSATGSGLHTGVVVAAETTGVVLGSVLGGPWIDRLRPRRAAVLFDLAAAPLLAAIPILHHLGALTGWALVVLAWIIGLTRGPGDAARLVLIPEITKVTATPVERVTAAHDTPTQAAKALGAPLAGALIALTGVPAVLLLDASSFLLSAAITATALPETTHQHSRSQPRTRLRQAWNFLRTDRTLQAIMWLAAATNAVNSGLFSVLVPAYGIWILGSSAHIGALYAVTGTAMITGTLLFTTLGLRLPRWPVLVTCYLLVFAPRSGIFLLQPPLVVLLIASGVLMLAFGPINPILAAVRTERTPPRLRARVFATISATATLAMPLGTITAGALGDQLGLMPALAVFTAAGGLLSLCPLLPAWRRLGAPPHPSVPSPNLTRSGLTHPAGQ
ncbi:macrolide resistance MFS transporter Mrx(A) [Saccharopolyspora halophila]|uniref:Macrolide resistance MFS transporter Mrx(A) n=2 Tax=Saccharopolyspora halophila TaxID=405551 RepID=A0ABN3GHW7_9PSEU